MHFKKNVVDKFKLIVLCFLTSRNDIYLFMKNDVFPF
jgi:hypothetical protein